MEENNWLVRTELLLGPEQVNALAHKHILQVGLAVWVPTPPRCSAAPASGK